MIGDDKVVETRYMLRMLGVPMKGPSIIFGDNLSVINSSAIPDDTLKKSTIEAIASKILMFYHVNGKDNPTDVLTKFLDSKTWWHFFKPLLCWPKDDDQGQPTP